MLLALLIGLAAVVLAALMHNYFLILVSRHVPRERLGKNRVTVVVFSCLLVVHMVEIAAFAAIIYGTTEFLWPQTFNDADPVSVVDILYLSGTNFTTLGYTQIEMTGPARLVAMLESLAGFMLLTWSATYLYSACGKYWQD